MTDLRDIVNAATPGPWEHYNQERDDGHDCPVSVIGTEADWHKDWLFESVDSDNHEADARFIATFDPPLVSALLDVAEHANALRMATPEYMFEAQDRLSAALDRLAALEDRP